MGASYWVLAAMSLNRSQAEPDCLSCALFFRNSWDGRRATLKLNSEDSAELPSVGKESTRERSTLLSTYTSLHQKEGPRPFPLTLPLHYWPTAEAEDMAQDAGLSVLRRQRGPTSHPSCCHVVVVRWQHDAPGWKEGLCGSHSLPRRDHLALASVKNHN